MRLCGGCWGSPSPFPTALGAHHHEGLPVGGREPLVEALQAALCVRRPDDRQRVRLGQLLQAEPLGPLQGVGGQAARVRVVVGVQGLLVVRRVLSGPAQQLQSTRIATHTQSHVAAGWNPMSNLTSRVHLLKVHLASNISVIRGKTCNIHIVHRLKQPMVILDPCRWFGISRKDAYGLAVNIGVQTSSRKSNTQAKRATCPWS